MEIPYDKFELMCALFDLTQSNFDEKKFAGKFKKISEEMGLLIPENKDKVVEKIAEYHNLEVSEMVKSPGYSDLCEKYVEHIISMFAKKVSEEFEITEKQAWALIAWSRGLLDV